MSQQRARAGKSIIRGRSASEPHRCVACGSRPSWFWAALDNPSPRSFNQICEFYRVSSAQLIPDSSPRYLHCETYLRLVEPNQSRER
jgi:hypothetical protein